MNSIKSSIKRHQLVSFVVLAYALSWWVALLPGGGLLPWGPMFAALIVVAFSEGRPGVKAWWRRVVRRKAGWGWYLVALFPIALNLTTGGLNLRLGATISRPIDWTTPFAVLPVMLLVSGMWEEPGWTGFALPRLLDHFGPSVKGTLWATLLMAVIRIGWHLPLMLSGRVYWSDIVAILAAQVVMAWLFHASRGSVLAVMLLHLLNNVMAGEFVMQWFTGADWVRLAWLQALLWGLLALGVLLLAGLQLGRDPVRRQNQPSTPSLG
ncbi:MAG: CPBP family intramembrane glutamic endopeptidase [Caldilineaceae bacterium]